MEFSINGCATFDYYIYKVKMFHTGRDCCKLAYQKENKVQGSRTWIKST